MFKPRKLWLITPIFTLSSLFAVQSSIKGCPQKSFEQGQELCKAQILPGYNAPASISPDESWDVYLIATYLYWQAQEENLEIGLISRNDPEGRLVPGGDDPFGTTYKNNISVTHPNFTYRPGCRFGIGTRFGWNDWDGWDASAIYTWFHGGVGSGVTPLRHVTTTTPLPDTPNGEYLYGIQGETNNFYYENANQSWNWKMDFIDLAMGRSSYSGLKFIVHPFFGARAAWIRQKLKTSYTGSPTYNSSPGLTQATNHDSSTSWGIGPRVGFESNWLLGYGVRLIGNGSLDVLYTRYSLRKNDQIAFINGLPTPIAENASVAQRIDYLKAHTDLELGFGWGSYFDYNNWHIDLWTAYGFQIFWDQNMFRNFVNANSMAAKSFNPNGNLYVHGVTINGRIDF